MKSAGAYHVIFSGCVKEWPNTGGSGITHISLLPNGPAIQYG
jgi:hypothetical protein